MSGCGFCGHVDGHGPGCLGAAVPAPFQAHSQTSRAAAREIAPKAGTLRAKVLEAIRSRGGATAEELEVALELGGSTVRPRVVELVRAGLVRDSGATRRTRSGRAATVWEAA